MKPGDLVTCSSCGTSATAYTSGDPARWVEGEAVLVSWGGYRHESARAAPERCLFCADGTKPRKAPTRRGAIMDELAVHGCRTDGFEWNTDELVERAHQRWVAAGRPRCVVVSVSSAGEGPLTGRSEASGKSDTAPGAQVGSKALSERPKAQLGLFA